MSKKIDKSVLNKVIVTESRRSDGSLRRQLNFENCPTLTEQHTAHLTDINYLMKKYKPDELASYIAARSAHRLEIIGHDFSKEPDLQEARNIVYRSKKAFDELPEEITSNFKNHVEFLKFIDNPANAEKMVKLGLLKPKELEELVIPDPGTNTSAPKDDVGGSTEAKS